MPGVRLSGLQSVRVDRSHLSAQDEREYFRNAGWYLACRLRLLGGETDPPLQGDDMDGVAPGTPGRGSDDEADLRERGGAPWKI